MFKGRKILLGITGSIAAYKSIFLLRLLMKEGAEVKVITTPAASDFVSSLTLSTLSHHPVLTDLFNQQSWSNHVMLGRWADVMLIAPLSCNTLAGMAQGNADNLLLATYLSATCPVVVAPAMDEDMWHHPATQANLKTIESYGNQVIPVAFGELASGLTGDGRMAEPEAIVGYLSDFFAQTSPLVGKKALVTAGPTYEAIDPVRFIGNHSSGKMGIAIARELQKKGCEVTLVIGPTQLSLDMPGIVVKKVTSSDEMYQACASVFSETDIAVMAAAVADYRPATAMADKIKKKDAALQIELVPTIDILKTLGARKRPGQVMVGFALETSDEETHASEKLESKNADMIVLNSLNDKGAGFGTDTNRVTISRKGAEPVRFETKPKDQVAADIVTTIISTYYA